MRYVFNSVQMRMARISFAPYANTRNPGVTFGIAGPVCIQFSSNADGTQPVRAVCGYTKSGGHFWYSLRATLPKNPSSLATSLDQAQSIPRRLRKTDMADSRLLAAPHPDNVKISENLLRATSSRQTSALHSRQRASGRAKGL